MKKLEDYVRSIPDFPEEGIIFRDVTTVLQDKDSLKMAIDQMQENLDGVDFDIVLGPESRGFIFGVPIAYNLNKAFVPVGSLSFSDAEIFKEGTFIEDLKLKVDVKARYVRFILDGPGNCPSDHVRPGQLSRIYVDEVVIR